MVDTGNEVWLDEGMGTDKQMTYLEEYRPCWVLDVLALCDLIQGGDDDA